MTRRKSEYAEKFKDPRWQKKRLEILKRDEWMCDVCGDASSTLHVHHRYYKAWGTDPWDYPDEALQTLCELCHESETTGRPEAEAELLRVTRQHFTYSDVAELARTLAMAFELHPQDQPAVQIMALCAVLEDADEWGLLVQRYWKRVEAIVAKQRGGK